MNSKSWARNRIFAEEWIFSLNNYYKLGSIIIVILFVAITICLLIYATLTDNIIADLQTFNIRCDHHQTYCNVKYQKYIPLCSQDDKTTLLLHIANSYVDYNSP